jgi:hypothetical protein
MATTDHPRGFRTPPAGAPVTLPAPASAYPKDAELARVRRMAHVLDRYLVDPVIGLLIPGAGDIVGSLLGLYTVAIAIRRRMSPVIVARMLLNLGVDAVLGFVPLLGDLADVGFKANHRNVALLTERAEHGGRATWRDWLVVIGAALAFFALIGLMVYAVVALLRAIF